MNDAKLSTNVDALRREIDRLRAMHKTKSILIKHPVAFRIRRADAETAGSNLSNTDWRYFTNEKDAIDESDALGTEYHGLYVRDGSAIVTEFDSLKDAIVNTLKNSAPGISETMRNAIVSSILIKLRYPKEPE